MKNGKKPTREQCKLISSYQYGKGSLNPANWLVVKNLSDRIIIVNRNHKGNNGKKLTIFKEN